MIDTPQDTADGPRTGHESKTRAEHLAWCKQRALLELDADPHGNGMASALASMVSDTNKHAETAGHPGNELGFIQFHAGFFRSPEQVRGFIEGYA